MHLIWKRPDGFQNAQPEDFRRIALSNGAHMWLHRHELDWYPFQVSGDWEGQDQTKRLNHLVNMLDAATGAWKVYLKQVLDNEFDNKESKDIADVAKSTADWILSLEKSTKGQTWEVEIMRCALHDVHSKLQHFW